jgi:hypothetical protein
LKRLDFLTIPHAAMKKATGCQSIRPSVVTPVFL